MPLLNVLLGIWFIGLNFLRRTKPAPFVPDVHPVTRQHLYDLCDGDKNKAHAIAQSFMATNSNPQAAWMEANESLR